MPNSFVHFVAGRRSWSSLARQSPSKSPLWPHRKEKEKGGWRLVKTKMDTKIQKVGVLIFLLLFAGIFTSRPNTISFAVSLSEEA